MPLGRSDLADFSYFLAIARHRSFRRAGVELGVSASALGHSLKGLEGRLGVRLLNPTNRSVTLTAAGEALRDAMRQVPTGLRLLIDLICELRPSDSSDGLKTRRGSQA